LQPERRSPTRREPDRRAPAGSEIGASIVAEEKRSADHRGSSVSSKRWSARGRSPSPRPSPAGRGSPAGRVSNQRTVRIHERAANAPAWCHQGIHV